MANPSHFDVLYAINPHMLDENGNLQKIDKPKAQKQWEHIKSIYESLGFIVDEIQGNANLPDFVFCANTFTAWNKDGFKRAILGRMKSEARQPEVAISKTYLESQGFECLELEGTQNFEAMGDLIWDIANSRLFMGHGYRTELSVLDQLKNLIPYEIIPLKLVSETYYHLDTCFATLNEKTCVYVESAFDQEALETIKKNFPKAIVIDEQEALNFFPGNLFCPDGKNVILNPGSQKLEKQLQNAGFIIHQADTSEYIKSGGSVFCMKNFIIEE